MSVIALESEVVGSRFDPATRTCFYTIERGVRRWTASVSLADLDAHKGNRQKRREHVGRALEMAMHGPPDKPIGTRDDPFKPQTADDFSSVPSGKWYVNPSDGALHQKP